MTNSPDPDGQAAAGRRKAIPQGILAALWTISNGRCYAPGCLIPVVLEVRPGVYQKNAEVAHVHGVRPGTPRYEPSLPDSVRDSFANLLLLCMAHHIEVDGNDGEKLYPPDTLRQWKSKYEGSASSVLNNLRVPSAEALMAKLLEIAEPPLGRLETIAARLEQTGTVTAETLAELREVIAALSVTHIGIDAHTASQLSLVADIFSGLDLNTAAKNLIMAADVLPSATARLEQTIRSATQFM